MLALLGSFCANGDNQDTPTITRIAYSPVSGQMKKSKELNPEFAVLEEGDIQFETNSSSLLGEGTFGKVYKGECFSSPVAVKVLLSSRRKWFNASNKVLTITEDVFVSQRDFKRNMEALISEVNILMYAISFLFRKIDCRTGSITIPMLHQ